MGTKAKMSKLSKRERRVKTAPATSALTVRVKGKPRGKMFQPGHGYGAEFRFKPGRSGNPSGRPHCKEISKALRERLASEVPLPAKTGAEKIAKKWFEESLGGNIAAMTSLADRAEGKPAVTMSVNEGADNIPMLLEGIARIHAERFPAGAEDDDELPQLTEGEVVSPDA
jgi:hypothetical protein